MKLRKETPNIFDLANTILLTTKIGKGEVLYNSILVKKTDNDAKISETEKKQFSNFD